MEGDKGMKKEYMFCYALIGILLMLCVMDVVLGKWLNFVCNSMWVVVEYTVLLSGKRHAEKRRELREQELLNEKFCQIMADLAVDLGKESETFDRIHEARLAAFEESMKED